VKPGKYQWEKKEKWACHGEFIKGHFKLGLPLLDQTSVQQVPEGLFL
jgi:hypothetical protein